MALNTIVAYYSAEVPQGWALCNGQTVNGHKTPDLRNRFVVSTGNKYNLNATGGSANAVVVSHNHSMNDAGNHRHSARVFNGGDGGGGYVPGSLYVGSNHMGEAGNHKHHINHSGESGTNKNLPPYVVLTYIIKID